MNQNINVVQRINFNLTDIKVENSKKRRRPGTTFLTQELGHSQYDYDLDSLEFLNQTKPKQRMTQPVMECLDRDDEQNKDLYVYLD